MFEDFNPFLLEHSAKRMARIRAEKWQNILDVENDKVREEELRNEIKKDVEAFYRIIGYKKGD